MNDRSWMLSAKAIKAARECIQLVKDELGIKLTLAHDDFMYMLSEYVELTDSIPLADAYANLLSYADTDQINSAAKAKIKSNVSAKVVPLLKERHPDGYSEDISSQEWVSFAGKDYPRWLEGKEFKGFYRGQPRYA